MHNRTYAVLALASACSLLLSGCGGAAGEGGPGEGKDEVTIVAGSYPLAFVAERVAGGAASVDNLTTPGVEAHDVELSPKQIGAVQQADVVVYLRGFQPAVDAAVDQAGPGEVVDLAAVGNIIEGNHEHDDGDEGHEDEGHETEATDPHAWLNPQNQVDLAESLADRLSEIDPANAATYRSNTDALTGELTALDDSFTQGLETCESRTIVTSHAAFGYLADRYDLEQVAIAGLDPSNEPSPAALAEITDTVRAEGVSTIFNETLTNPAIAETVARETGANLATLDPIEGLSEATADEDYFSIMEANLQAIRKANNCS